MRFQDSSGTYFQLNINGYAEPHARNYSRANWLRIKISASGPFGSWRTECPGLTTYEAGWLADWLEEAAKGTETRQRLDFLEPSLAFLLLDLPEGLTLRICLEGQVRPQWMSPRPAGQHEVWLDFPLPAAESFARAAADLRRELARFPERKPAPKQAVRGKHLHLA